MPASVRTFGPSEFESVTLGAPTLEAGIAYLFEKTGLRAMPLPSPPGEWSLNAVLPTTTGAMIEVLAPDPAASEQNLLAPELAALSEPQLIYWAVNTVDFDEAARIAQALEHPVISSQWISVDLEARKQTGRVGRLGPDQNFVRPLLTHWDSPPVYPGLPEPECVVTGFHLTDWEVPPLNRLLDGLDIGLRAVPGSPSLRLEMETPRGPATLESGDWIIGGLKQGVARWGRWLLQKGKRPR